MKNGPALTKRKASSSLVSGFVTILIFGFGGYMVFWSTNFGGIFAERQQDDHRYLLAAAHNEMKNLTAKILTQSQQRLAAMQTPAELRSLEAHLDSLRSTLESIAITDRSASLDNVFERFSTLIGIVTLIFGGFGVYTALQFYEHMRQIREDFGRVKREIDEKRTATVQEIYTLKSQTNREFDRTVDNGSAMIWMVANTLEQLINSKTISDVKAYETLASLYLSGFRFQLHSRDKNERTSALQNIWAQGDCSDLEVLWSIAQNADEPADIRSLAQLAIAKISKKCPHPGGHPEVYASKTLSV